MSAKKKRLNIKDGVRLLTGSTKKPFVIAKISPGFNNTEKKALKGLKLTLSEVTGNYGYCGAYNSGLKDRVSKYIQSLGNTKKDSDITADLIVNKIIGPFMRSLPRQQYLWLAIRPSKPNSHFKVPRWHTDGQFFHHEKFRKDPKFYQMKLAATLKGPSTILKAPSKSERTAFRKFAAESSTAYLAKDMASVMRIREEVAIRWKDIKIETPKYGEVAIFVTGNRDRAGFHSEPHTTSDRLFLSVLPGDKDGMAAFAKKKGEKFYD